MTSLLHKSVWEFLIVIARIYELLQWIYYNCIVSVVHRCLSWNLQEWKSDISYLEQIRPMLDKIPSHLSIIIGLDDINPKILTNIAAYALITGVDHISYFDVKNNFSLDQRNIPKYIKRQELNNGRFLWSMQADKKSGLLKYKNGLERTIKVVMLTNKDGKPLIADVCKELCMTKHSPEVKEILDNKEKLTKKINLSLQKRLNNMPEPELAILFDRTLCTFGLLPWHTGFTEFHQVESSNVFDVRMFADVLLKYSKCQQRFGK